MGFVLSLLTSRLAGPIASVVAVILALALGWQTLQLNGARSDLKDARASLATAKAELKTCKINRQTLEGALARQNEAVDELRREGEARVAASRKALSAARSEAEGYRRSAAAILRARPKGEDRCASAEALIREVAG